MDKTLSTFIAIGGGEMSEAGPILDYISGSVKGKREPRILVMTVATEDDDGAAKKYAALFRKIGFKHVDSVRIIEREDSFSKAAAGKMQNADAVFFTGGDQLNITTLFGGTPLHELMRTRMAEGCIVIGTSAGAAMMSGMMIVGGKSESAPRVSGIDLAPGLGLVCDAVIDSHFSQRGRHGRLLTAVAHHPHILGVGIDERTAAVFKNGAFSVIGEGVVTVFDGCETSHSDLPYKDRDEPIGMFGARIHVLPAEYKFDTKSRTPIAPTIARSAN